MATIQIPGSDYQSPDRTSQTFYGQMPIGGDMALAESQAGAAQSGLRFANAVAGLIGKAKEERDSREYATAVTAYNKWATDTLRDMQANPRMVSEDREQPYYNNYKEWADGRDTTLEELSQTLSDPRTAERFRQYAANRNVSWEDSLKQFDIEKNRELLFDSFGENYQAHIEAGDVNGLYDVVQEYRENGTLGEVQADDYLDEGFYNIAKRSIYMNAFAMGPEQGIEFVANADNLQYQTYDGEQRQLTLQDQEQMRNRLRIEWDLQRKRELEERRSVWFDTDNEAYQRFANGNLTLDWITNFEGFDRFDGDPGDLRSKWLRMLESSTNAPADGESDPAALQEIANLWADEYVMPPEFKNEIDRLFQEGRISQQDHFTWVNRADLNDFRDQGRTDKPLNANIRSGVRRIYDHFGSLIREAEKDGDNVLANQLRTQLQTDLNEYTAYISQPEVDSSQFLRDDQWIDKVATNIITRRLDDRASRQLNELVDTDLSNEQLYNNAGLFSGRLNDAENLQKAIQEGQIFGRESDYRVQLNQLEQNYTREAVDMIGSQPALTDIGAGGSVLLFYPDDTPGQYRTYAETQNGRVAGNYYTFQVNDNNDYELRIWDGRAREWAPVPDGMKAAPYWQNREVDTREERPGLLDRARNFVEDLGSQRQQNAPPYNFEAR